MKLIFTVLCAILLAGVSHAASSLSFEAGEEYTFTVLAVMPTIVSCHLTNPDGLTMDFIPGEANTQYGDRYELLPIASSTLSGCSITVKNLQESDSGLWEVSFRNPSNTGPSESFDITVVGPEIHDEEEIEDDNVNWLNPIEFPTRTGQIIDISLPKMEYEEKCTIRSPAGDDIRASEVNIDGVTVHDSSNFVSCRITIGPMVESLLGAWAVCGAHIVNNEEHVRCQLATISWNNVNRPETVWNTVTQPKFEHPVHFGHTLAPVVIGAGEIVSCHIVTPNGEDLVIDQESQYPGITADTMVHSICGIAIGPIDRFKIGSWTIYGLFRNAVAGLNEVRFPIETFLYDPENPYSHAYNVTIIDPVLRVVNLGNTLNVEVSISAGQVDSCQFETPLGLVYNEENYHSFTGASFTNEAGVVACRVAIGPITKELLGNWTITGKFSNNGLFSELQQNFQVILEDPENPIEEDRIIIYLNSQTLQTEIGLTHRLVINSDVFTNAESCHIRTPDGLQYKIMEGFSLAGIEAIEESGVECGVTVNVVSEDIVGEWTLIARATRHSESIERRLPFTIYVEESVEASPTEITITEGNDLLVRLKNPTDQYETCKLIGPYGFECTSAESDPLHVNTCGFIKRNMQTSNSGTWTITYGNRIVYKAEIAVTVNSGSIDTFSTTLNLLRDRSVNEAVGPENAVYCTLIEPQGSTVFEGFGRCNLTLDKVETEHHGEWRMLVGTPGRVLTDEYRITVNVRESEGKAVVRTQVDQAKPIVTVSCTVATDANIQACKFRDPQGRILLAARGLTEGRYAFHGSEVTYENNVRTYQCGIQITDPLVTDLGLWRCAIETTEDTYYGHMPVLCPWALMDPAVAAAVQQEPILKANRPLVNVVEEEPATMTCSVESTIRYCYFRVANGTVFTVTPGMSSSSMEFVGAGFDAGECGVRFHGMRATDSGRWSCHVGLVGDHEEQRDQFQVIVHERMSVNHFNGHGNVMTVEGMVHERRALEYCRFVRMDGFGFTSDSVPSQYTLTGLLANGECQFTARNPSILDLHPWTVVAKIRGQDVEISKDTMEAILIGVPTPAPQPENPDVVIPIEPPNGNSGLTIFLYVFLCVILVAILLGVWLGPKRHREWTSARASAFRRSLSNSFKKEQPKPAQMPNHNI